MAEIDGYTISLVRYLLAVAGLLPILAWREGRSALSFDGRGAIATVAGVVVVVTRGGSALSELAGSSARELVGDLLVFLGALAWVSYALMAERFAGWSSLRTAALTCTTALGGILGVWILALAAGAAWIPSAAAIATHGWRLGYLGLLGVLAAMFLWNEGIRRIGPLNAMLILSLMPVITFAFRALEGARFAPAEISGAGLVVGALVANNLYLRARPSGAPAGPTPPRAGTSRKSE
jgi:drug/metabolite transporter (DMT)-like permease